MQEWKLEERNTLRRQVPVENLSLSCAKDALPKTAGKF